MSWDIVRQSVRRLCRRPGYAIPVIASLTLGIGLNTAIFSELAFVLRRPLQFPQAGEIVAIGRILIPKGATAGETPATSWGIFKNDVDALLKGPRTLQSVAAYFPEDAPVIGRGQAEYITGAGASPSFLRVLRVAPARGRWFTDEETRANVVVLSHSLWQRQFAGDSNVVGQTLRIRDEPWTVIGVMPKGAALPINAEYWTPLRNFTGEIIARLNDGATREQVAAECLQMSPGAANLIRAGYGVRYVVAPLHDRLFGATAPALRLIFVAAALLFLIACANVANLGLARAMERRREFAVLTALGARRAALASIVGTENGIVALCGAGIGVLVAYWGVGVLVAVAPKEVTDLGVPTLDAMTVAFAFGAALVAALLVSLAPVTVATDTKIQPLLGQAGQPGSHERIKPTMRRMLVSTQIALAMVLIAAAGLVLKSIATLTREDRIGFSARGVVTAWLPYLPTEFRGQPRAAFTARLAQRLQAIPGVREVAFGPPPLVAGRGESYREGFSTTMSYRDSNAAGVTRTTLWLKEVDASYLNVFQLRLRSGRNFQAADNELSEPVAIITARTARKLFGDQDATGRFIEHPYFTRNGGMPPRVVGVIDDVLQRDLALEAFPEILLPISQRPGSFATSAFSVRATTDPAQLANAIRKVLRDLAPGIAAARLEPMQAVVDASARRHVFILRLLGVFAALGVVLASIGVYSVIAYLVARRRVELGVRMALGARASDVLGLVMREGAVLTLVGVLAGTIAALGATRLLKAFLFEVTPHDAPTFLIAPLAFAVIALVAALIPALRAASISPAVALRD